MKIEGIKYVGPAFDGSGYAKSIRENILALNKLGVPITIDPMQFEVASPNLGKDAGLLHSMIDKKIDYNFNIIHTTPEFWEKHLDSKATNVGLTMWETTKLHKLWPKYINNSVSKMLTVCDWNEEVFRNSGITIPIGVTPIPIDLNYVETNNVFSIEGLSDDTYVFYSINQWVERKNPIAVIKAFWWAFQNNENVALVYKTYRSDYREEEKNAVRLSIKRLKQMMPMDTYPPIFLIPDMLTEDEIRSLHLRGDCYVSLDRGEGFGLGSAYAGAFGNPVIATGFGGTTEFAKPDNSYLINYSLTPVSGMPWCMALNSLVKTTTGYIQAKDLVEGSVVINKNLNNKRINKVEVRPLLPTEEVYSIKYFSVPTSVELTADHKLYVLVNDVPIKKKVSEISVGDYLYVPKPIKHSNLLVDHALHDKQDNLFYLCGLYIAEGYLDKNKKSVSFCFNINEKNTLGSKCKEYMYEVFGDRITSFYDRELTDRNGYELTFYVQTSMLTFFETKFGCGSHSKFIDEAFKYSKYNHNLLMGYWDGDGHIRKEGYKNKKTGKVRISPECVAETASFSLSMDIRELLLSIGVVPSVYKSERKDGRVSYIISVSDMTFDNIFNINANRINSSFKKEVVGGYGVKVTNIEVLDNYEDLICSISVDCDGDEDVVDGGSYILNGVASSNSPWYSGDQLWAEVDVHHAAKTMRYVYENQEEAKKTGLKLKEHIKENLSYEVIGNKIIKELESIE